MSKLVGILNVTPDSFSDGADMTPQAVLAKAQQLIDAGADVLDVGAESTRPDASPLSAQEEWARLEAVWPQLHARCAQRGVLLSLDTRHGETARRALAIGCDWINDVSGFRGEAMVDAVRGCDCKLVVMHALSVPAVKGESLPNGTDMAAFMRGWMADTQARLVQQHIAHERIIFDAGIGFGKNLRQNWQLLAQMQAYKGDFPLLVGHSRKSLFAPVSGLPVAQRDDMTRAVSAMLAMAGADYLRVHDVAGHRVMLEQLS